MSSRFPFRVEVTASGGRSADSGRWLWPLVATLLMQTITAFLCFALPVMGPSLTRAARVPPELVGHLAGLTAAGTMGFMVVGGVSLRRFGSVRTLQLGALLGAGALLVVATGSWPVLLLAAFAIGVGYGPSPPAGSDILARYAPSGRRSLIFSIKQSGVPLGGVLAGLILPPSIGAFGWRWAIGIGAALVVASVLVVQPLRGPLDAGRDVSQPISLGAWLSPANLRAPFTVLRDAPGLVPLVVTGVVFASVQGCLLPFLVTFLATEVGFSLATAGLAFSATQTAGFAARVVMGWVADRIGSGIKTLLLLAGGSCLMMLLISTIAPGWPFWAVAAVGIGAGFASISWNGVYLAEVARLAPPARVGDATAGSTFFVFIAYFVAPIVFSTAVSVVGSYAVCFAVVALIPLAVVPVLWPLARGSAT